MQVGRSVLGVELWVALRFGVGGSVLVVGCLWSVGISWGYVGPSWGLCCPSLRLCGPILELCWPILGAMLPHLGAMFAHLEAYVDPF